MSQTQWQLFMEAVERYFVIKPPIMAAGQLDRHTEDERHVDHKAKHRNQAQGISVRPAELWDWQRSPQHMKEAGTGTPWATTFKYLLQNRALPPGAVQLWSTVHLSGLTVPGETPSKVIQVASHDVCNAFRLSGGRRKGRLLKKSLVKLLLLTHATYCSHSENEYVFNKLHTQEICLLFCFSFLPKYWLVSILWTAGSGRLFI